MSIRKIESFQVCSQMLGKSCSDTPAREFIVASPVRKSASLVDPTEMRTADGWGSLEVLNALPGATATPRRRACKTKSDSFCRKTKEARDEDSAGDGGK